jgi:sulfatase maturation enzyme AslB (radical SAM superfamily)
MGTTPCHDCPILLSCHYKRTNPKECNWKPAPMKPRASTREPSTQHYLSRMAKQESAMRAGVIEFRGDF